MTYGAKNLDWFFRQRPEVRHSYDRRRTAMGQSFVSDRRCDDALVSAFSPASLVPAASSVASPSRESPASLGEVEGRPERLELFFTGGSVNAGTRAQRRNEAIHGRALLDCFAALAMTA
jgi:hypothetical protein